MNNDFTDLIMASVDKSIDANFARQPIKTLGEVILLLEGQPQSNIIKVDINGDNPTHFDSYRGYYRFLSIDYGEKPATVAELLAKAKQADGQEFTGYKGGDFLMSRKTLVFVAPYGMTGRMLVNITSKGNVTTIHTEQEEGNFD